MDATPEPQTEAGTSVDKESRRQDDELVARTQAGDAAAFDELIVKYSPRLYGLVYHMTSNHEDTHDMMQDIWAKAFRSINTFRGKSSFYTWIHSVGVNMTLNFLKKRNRRSHQSLDDLDSGIERDKDLVELAANSTPIREANLKELQKRLNDALQTLSHDHRTVVTMSDIQGIPHAEIAKILGISEGTVRSRLFYAHQRLQNYLSEFLS
jgi:RNA polymerase sigma-70 factor (ECF subfamily)